MVDVAGIVLGIVGTGLTTYITTSYRNSIVYSLLSQTVEVAVSNYNIVEVGDNDRSRSLTTQTLRLKNTGFRSLKSVELHFRLREPAIYKEVTQALTISKSAISLEAAEGFLRIIIPTFPRGEEIEFTFASRTGYASSARDLSGTGGPYKVIEAIRRREQRVALLWMGFAALMAFFALVGGPALDNYTSACRHAEYIVAKATASMK